MKYVIELTELTQLPSAATGLDQSLKLMFPTKRFKSPTVSALAAQYQPADRKLMSIVEHLAAKYPCIASGVGGNQNRTKRCQ